MKTQDEKEYYRWLEKVIREKKRNVPFFNTASREAYEADIAILVNHIRRLNPRLVRSVVSNAIEFDGALSEKELLSLLSQSDKGAMVCVRDKNGRQTVYVNAGESPGNKKESSPSKSPNT
jgi:hypothetical protein